MFYDNGLYRGLLKNRVIAREHSAKRLVKQTCLIGRLRHYRGMYFGMFVPILMPVVHYTIDTCTVDPALRTLALRKLPALRKLFLLSTRGPGRMHDNWCCWCC
ncbi:unnamed protein product [Ectocarpus sp. 13 AM-2016]